MEYFCGIGTVVDGFRISVACKRAKHVAPQACFPSLSQETLDGLRLLVVFFSGFGRPLTEAGHGLGEGPRPS